MSDSFAYRPAGIADRTHALFAQTMGYVAATAGLFALGAYLGGGVAIVAYQAERQRDAGLPAAHSPRSAACSACGSRHAGRRS
jgi:hypothetical protein